MRVHYRVGCRSDRRVRRTWLRGRSALEVYCFNAVFESTADLAPHIAAQFAYWLNTSTERAAAPGLQRWATCSIWMWGRGSGPYFRSLIHFQLFIDGFHECSNDGQWRSTNAHTDWAGFDVPVNRRGGGGYKCQEEPENCISELWAPKFVGPSSAEQSLNTPKYAPAEL